MARKPPHTRRDAHAVERADRRHRLRGQMTAWRAKRRRRLLYEAAREADHLTLALRCVVKLESCDVELELIDGTVRRLLAARQKLAALMEGRPCSR